MVTVRCTVFVVHEYAAIQNDVVVFFHLVNKKEKKRKHKSHTYIDCMTTQCNELSTANNKDHFSTCRNLFSNFRAFAGRCRSLSACVAVYVCKCARAHV